MHSITFSLVWIKTNSPFVLYYFNAALYNKIDAFPNKLSRFRIPFHRHFHFSIIVQWMWLLFLDPYFLSVRNKIYKTNMLLVVFHFILLSLRLPQCGSLTAQKKVSQNFCQVVHYFGFAFCNTFFLLCRLQRQKQRVCEEEKGSVKWHFHTFSSPFINIRSKIMHKLI